MVKDPITPKGKIVSSLRRLWLHSRERNEALKVGGRKCSSCGVKASVARSSPQKIEVHHKGGVLNWDEMVATIRQQLLVGPDKLKCLCPDCHKAVDDA